MFNFLRKNKLNQEMDLSNCLDLTDKANIEIEEKDDGMIHVTAQLWLWDQQYMTIVDRCGIAKKLGRSSFNIVCEGDDIINAYIDIREKKLSVNDIADTNERREVYKAGDTVNVDMDICESRTRTKTCNQAIETTQ